MRPTTASSTWAASRPTRPSLRRWPLHARLGSSSSPLSARFPISTRAAARAQVGVRLRLELGLDQRSPGVPVYGTERGRAASAVHSSAAGWKGAGQGPSRRRARDIRCQPRERVELSRRSRGCPGSRLEGSPDAPGIAFEDCAKRRPGRLRLRDLDPTGDCSRALGPHARGDRHPAVGTVTGQGGATQHPVRQ